ncbi:MAG: acyl carrier protein familyprotein [Firmicutes bacterium]|nr:acyl carrier protein familyprotein [Bacillota bacterium]
MELFLEQLAEILDIDVEQLSIETYLSDIEEWDSLSVISFAAMADIKYGKKLTAPEIKKAQTAEELFALVGGV